MTIPTSFSYTYDPRPNDNHFRSDQYKLLGSLGLGKYSGIGENSFDLIYCSATFSGGFLPVGSKIPEMDHRDIKYRLMARI